MNLNEAIEILKVGDEKALRELKMPEPQTVNDLNRIVDAVTVRSHDYGTCIYAMSIAAEAALNYVARQLGVTGFQASCADLDIVRRTRLLDGPFAIITGNDMLYPQYDIHAKVDNLLNQWRPWAKEEAVKLLSETKEEHTHPDVREHWQRLAA